MRDVYVVGVGMTPLGRHLDKRLRDLGRIACFAALKDAGLKPKDIQAGFCGNALAPALQGETGVGQNVMWEVGINEIPIINIENACCSGSTAFREAWLTVASGLYDIAMVVGVEKTYTEKGGVLDIGKADLELMLGMVLPSYFGMLAQSYIHENSISPEDLALVAVKNRFHGSLNPYSQFQKPVTFEEVISSPMITDPLTRLSCCPLSDGAAAAILASENVAMRLNKKSIIAAASVLRTGSYQNTSNLNLSEMFKNLNARAANEAYNMAGLGPEDVDLAEVHDCFTITEVLHYESLGFCKKGDGVKLLKEGKTQLGGKVPFSVSGGLLAKGHPVGCTGVAQIVEAVWQLRGEAGKRQVPGARVALTHTMGGLKEGDAKATTINILRTK
jgi:acetyl-CoA acetyltransferase